MAVVLISTQGTSKTSTLRTMVPHEDHYVELDLNARDEDLCRKMRGKLIGEMAELRGISGKDVESVKAWISRRREEWVPKYLEFSRTFPRRLVLVGTSNQEEFLADETGNRRWLPMLVGPKQDIGAIERDRTQLWAEAYDAYLGGGILWAEAERLAKEQHGDFMIHDENEFLIDEWMHAVDSFTGDRPIDREYLLMHDIAKGALGVSVEKLDMRMQFRVGRTLRKMGFVKFRRRVNGKMCKVWQKGGFHWVDESGVTP
jgi:predicted P-loop ATPase